MIAGIDYSSGDGIVCMDADLQHPVECIPQILDMFNQGYEVISMVRTANKSAGFVKNLTSGLFYKILNKISEVHFEENASDFFAITKKPACEPYGSMWAASPCLLRGECGADSERTGRGGN